MKYVRKYLDKKILYPLFTGFLLFLLVKLFWIDTEVVRSPSMQPALKLGEWVFVKKLFVPQRNDVVQVALPLSDADESQEKVKVFKRLTGMPGDTITIINSRLFVNGRSWAGNSTLLHNYIAKIKTQADTVAFGDEGAIEKYLIDDSCVYLLILDDKKFGEMKLEKKLYSLLSNAEDSALYDETVFPYKPEIKWNKDHFGPLYIPKAGDEIKLDAESALVYERLIALEGSVLEVQKGKVYVNETEATSYTVKQNYYFVTGDNFDNSIDSRHWGLIPENKLKARLLFQEALAE